MLLSSNIIVLIGLAAGVSLVMMAATVVQLVTGKSGWIDTLWTFAVGAGGVAAALLPTEGANDLRRLCVGLLVAVWALRLGLHIAARTHGGEDDPRYAAIKADHPKDWPVYLFGMLQAQAIAAFVLVLAVRFAAINPAPFPAVTDLIGMAILLVAFIGEGVADAQLRAFGKTHKKAVADTGLWRWSRHPNYFFEWLGWCGWAVIALSGPFGWLALLAPVQMYILLVYVSGIPPLEKHMRETRGQAFDDYAARTSAFFPLPPKSRS
ncbi:DUF1295 domain-containing protein [Asticcacaulis taihuensis]|uniref:Steroid 5-alpha reductase family enzyme n=1 Tax=Asticcacaulis taihuensis TaxID=260084 RepID=A0A1G4RB98_9CAUL|nr:DUF1295 domain-containing protein [Asticcacaulis taihuensis]SCW54088.1 Steroid 5-alpha reductase family enzyme [Asticcacaulis taihuensis]